MFDLNWTWVEIECPDCKYQDEIQLIDAKTERIIFCHNCKVIIELKDSDASVHSTVDSVNQAFRDLEKALKNFGK
jgi:Zn ribbon nucleic-acid-binding protein